MKLQKLRVMNDSLYYESQGKRPYCFFPARSLDGVDYYLCKAFDDQARIGRALLTGALVSVVGTEQRDPETEKKFFIISYLETEETKPKPKSFKIEAPVDKDALLLDGVWKKKIEILMDLRGVVKVHEDLSKLIKSTTGKIQAKYLAEGAKSWSMPYEMWKEVLLYETLTELGLEIGEDKVIRAIRKSEPLGSGEEVSEGHRGETEGKALETSGEMGS